MLSPQQRARAGSAAGAGPGPGAGHGPGLAPAHAPAAGGGAPGRGSARALAAAAAQLGLTSSQAVAPELQWILREIVDPKALPEGWTVYTDSATGRPFYYHKPAARSAWVHPGLAFYKGAAFMAQGGADALADAEARDPPTDEDVRNMAAYLGIRPGEPASVRDVARLAVSAPLPGGWTELWEGEESHFYVESGRPNAKKQLEHPLDLYFSELVMRRRKEAASAAGGDARAAARAARRAAAGALATGAAMAELEPEPRGTGPPSGREAAGGREGGGGGGAVSPDGGHGHGNEGHGHGHGAHGNRHEGPSPHHLGNGGDSQADPGTGAAPHGAAPEHGGAASPAPPAPAPAQHQHQPPLPTESLQAGMERTSSPGPGGSFAVRPHRRDSYVPSTPPTGLAEGGGNGPAGPHAARRDGGAGGPGTSHLSAGSLAGAPDGAGYGRSTIAPAPAEMQAPPQQARPAVGPGSSAAGPGPSSSAAAAAAAGVGPPFPGSGGGGATPPRGGAHTSRSERFTVCVRARPLEKNARTSWAVDPDSGTVQFVPPPYVAGAGGAAAPKRTSTFYGELGGTFRRGAEAAFLAATGGALPGGGAGAGERPGGGGGPTAGGFRFDAVFADTSDTAPLYQRCVADIVRSAMAGINGTVFAYGQTGSGKTHTITGTKAHPGLLPLAVHDVFAAVGAEAGTRDYSIRLGMLEIYNEELRDLLAPSFLPPVPGAGKGKAKGRTPAAAAEAAAAVPRLMLKEDPDLGIVVAGLHRQLVASESALSELLQVGFARRQVGSHRMNELSSRSHVIFRLEIVSCPAAGAPAAGPGGANGPGALRFSTLHLVDLAGSERIAKSGASGSRVVESTNINLSLLALGNVIARLAEGNRDGGAGADAGLEEMHVPYRNSKITRLLQPCLGGNSRTAVVATVSLAESHAEETSHTLRFASRARRVTNRVRVNEVARPTLAKLQNNISRLEAQLEAARARDPEIPALPTLAAAARGTTGGGAPGRAAGGRGEPARQSGDKGAPGGAAARTLADLISGSSALDSFAVQIARAIGFGAGGAGGAAAAAAAAAPETLLTAVRQLRAEKEDLKKRATAASERVAALQALAAERSTLELTVRGLEEAFGGTFASQAPMLARVQSVAQAAGVMSAEMAGMQQRAMGALGMYHEVQAREHELRVEVQAARERERYLLEAAKERSQLQDKLQAALAKRDELCLRLGKRPAEEFSEPATGAWQEAIATYVRGLEARLRDRDAETRLMEAEMAELRLKAANVMEDAVMGGGRAALRATREALLRASAAEEQAKAVLEAVARDGAGYGPWLRAPGLPPTEGAAEPAVLAMAASGPLPPIAAAAPAAPAAPAPGRAMSKAPSSGRIAPPAPARASMPSLPALPAAARAPPAREPMRDPSWRSNAGSDAPIAGHRGGRRAPGSPREERRGRRGSGHAPELLASQTMPAHRSPAARGYEGENGELELPGAADGFFPNGTPGRHGPRGGSAAPARRPRASGPRPPRKEWDDRFAGKDYSANKEVEVLKKRLVAAQRNQHITRGVRAALHLQAVAGGPRGGNQQGYVLAAPSPGGPAAPRFSPGPPRYSPGPPAHGGGGGYAPSPRMGDAGGSYSDYPSPGGPGPGMPMDAASRDLSALEYALRLPARLAAEAGAHGMHGGAAGLSGGLDSYRTASEAYRPDVHAFPMPLNFGPPPGGHTGY